MAGREEEGMAKGERKMNGEPTEMDITIKLTTIIILDLFVKFVAEKFSRLWARADGGGMRERERER